MELLSQLFRIFSLAILTLENTQIYLVFCSLIRIFADMKQRTEEEYYSESRRLRDETMQMADSLRDNPLRFTITNGITMDVEVTKSDLKTIVSKNTQDNRFNAFKNKLAQDIRGFLEKANMRAGARSFLANILKRPISPILAESWGLKHIFVFVKSRTQAFLSHTPLLTRICLTQKSKTSGNKKTAELIC